LVDYSAYSPSLPASIKVSPQFGLNFDFIIDGIIDLEVERTNWPTITFLDDSQRQVLTIQIDPASSNLVVANMFDVSNSMNYNSDIGGTWQRFLNLFP